ncbi:MAG TPA: protein kinase, partial [Thermoanaerobaculia bacterium]|nr:protein kinase [Thermoanaerobaculia bacterium]
MTPDRWRAIERLYEAALERTPDQRDAFLNESCNGDEALRSEVASLLEYQGRALDFMESEAASPVAEAMRRVRDSSAPGRFAGRVFGFYQLKEAIGAGGMGEVYRAVDTRLDRIVAVKILPEPNQFSSRERFKREAKIISSLNHAHICALYDIGTEDGNDYLVMEHLDGETLEERLRRGAVPFPQALEFLIQIVDALDKIHRCGIVHRDLKPANVILTKSGVKLLDFGIAAPAVRAAAPDSPALTAEGVIVGTMPYMAPEQIQGAPVTTRTDIFAFGALAYEMLTGRKAFDGRTQPELITAILRDTPAPIESLVQDVPTQTARAIERCLAKDPDERWQSASDLLFQLRATTVSGLHRSATKPSAGSRWLERAGWAAAILVLAALIWFRERPQTGDAGAPGVPVRFSLRPAPGVFLSGTDVPFALSPDGRKIAYVGTSAGASQQLWLRSLDSDEQQALPGTEGASTPFWSPDSQWIGFFAEDTLKKVRISSALTQVIASDVATFGGASWNRDDVIVFPAFRGGLARVSARGGPVTRLPVDDGIQFYPHFLSDGKRILYGNGQGTIRIGSLNGDPVRTLMTFPVRVSTLGYAPGCVFYVQDSTLFARVLDERRLEVVGAPVRLADGIPITTPARAPFSVSAAGVLAYWPYTLGTPATLRWFDRDGRASAPVAAPAQYRGFTLSPDGRRLIVSRIGRTGADLWLRDFDGTAETQLTFEGAAVTPLWSPEGTRIAYSGYGQGPPPKLYVKDMAGRGAAALVVDTRLPNFASSWSADGGTVVSVRTTDPARKHDLWIQRLQDHVSQPLPLNTPSNESHGKVSPDGRWLAY